MLSSLLRIVALIRKEFLAVLKDPRSRFIIFLPPILQCLLFGYAASFDLNSAFYAVLDQDRSSGLHRPARPPGWIHHLSSPGRSAPDRGHHHLDRQQPRASGHSDPAGFRTPSAGRRTSTDPGHRRWPQLQYRRNRTGLCRDHGRRFQRRLARQSGSARPIASGRHPRMVQSQPGFTLEHDPKPDRHADLDGNADADGDVRRPRARTRYVRSASGHAVPAVRNHGGKGAFPTWPSAWARRPPFC